MARENDQGEFEVGFVVGDGELEPYPEGEPRYYGNFCVSTDDEGIPDGKVIGLQVDGTRWVNPNQCAQKALAAEREQLDSTHSRPEGDSGGPCGKPPCEHPGGGRGADGGNDGGDDDGEDTDEITVTWEGCETVTLTGPADDLARIDLQLIRCFDDDLPHKTPLDGSTGCPTGHVVTREDPDLPLTLGRDELALGDEQYFVDAVDLFGGDESHGGTAESPDDLDCSFESIGDEINIEFEMDDQTITLTEDEGDLSEVTITGFAEFGYAGWEDHGPVGHAFITSWAQSDADVDFPDRDIQRYFDVDGDTGVVTKDVEISFDVPAEVGDPEPGETIETEILGQLFVGLERGTDPEESQNIGDWRDEDPMTLRVERE